MDVRVILGVLAADADEGENEFVGRRLRLVELHHRLVAGAAKSVPLATTVVAVRACRR